MDDGMQPEDIVQQGRGEQRPARFRRPGWWPSRTGQLLLAAALAVGLVAGYLAGHLQVTKSVALPGPSASVPVGPGATFSFSNAPSVAQDLGACSAQQGHELQLGVQVSNQSLTTVTLLSARAVLPMAGLRQVAQRWTPCGELANTATPLNDVLPAGTSGWLTVTLQVLVSCPTALPVGFAIRYETDGKQHTVTLSGFNDLGEIPYSGCPAS
jgi:hypothetical protein